MARRRKKPVRRTRYKSAFNLRSVGISLASLGIATRAAFRTSPMEFFFAGYSDRLSGGAAATGQGSSTITLYEFLNWNKIKPYGESYAAGTTALDMVGENLQDNFIPAIIQMAGLKVADKVLMKIGLYRNFNKLVRSAGFGDLVKM